MSRRNKSFIWGGITAVILFIAGIIAGNIPNYSMLAVTGFTLVSCLVLDNNFLGDMILEIFSWGFVKFPGLIFTLDLDGIIWLITVKLFLSILAIMLSVFVFLIGVVVALVVAPFTFPFATARVFREKRENAEQLKQLNDIKK